ncbi:uncharacterized protein LOC135476290 [Liolophura sinensis]|uniref:uncharacterized protein LOC135476290 n=1 Tax=Liolophura sinensis TaxID=3198878 RepID=UPI0031593577
MSKDPGKDLTGKKAQYYVEYLGWRPCRGLEGREFTEPIVQDLLCRRHTGHLPKLTIQISKKDIKVSREVTEDGKKKKIKTIKYPSIPSRDVTFATQALEPNNDVVACTYLGFNPKTSSYVHVHVYRCDSPHTARTFVHHLNSITSLPEHRKRLEKIEQDLLSKNAIDVPYPTYDAVPNGPHGRFNPYPGARNPRMESSATSAGTNERSPTGSDDLDADLVSLKDVKPFDSIADELKQRLNVKAAPLLLPPADYDTVSRARGNLDEAQKRRTRNPIIVGEGGLEKSDPQNGSTGSDEVETPDSDKGDDHQFPSEGFYLYPPRSPRDFQNEPASPRGNVFSQAASSPRTPRQGLVPQHGRQLSNSSTHSHHSNGSGSYQPNGMYDSRERLASDRLSGFSNSSNSHRDLSVMDEPRSDYARRDLLHDEVLLRQKDIYQRGPHLTNSMPNDVLRREMAAVADRDSYPRHSGHSGYPDRFSPRQPASPRPGDFAVRKVNSMYR